MVGESEDFSVYSVEVGRRTERRTSSVAGQVDLHYTKMRCSFGVATAKRPKISTGA